MKILSEALEKYDVDGLFFNMFGNQSRDYSGRYVGLCHCDACKRLYREKFHKDIPETPDDDYRKFMFTSSREVAAAIGDLIHAKAAAGGLLQLHPGIHRRDHVGIEHGGGAAPAAVAVLGQRPRESGAQQPAGQDGGQPEHAVRGFLLALRHGAAAERSRCAAGRTWRTAARSPSK